MAILYYLFCNALTDRADGKYLGKVCKCFELRRKFNEGGKINAFPDQGGSRSAPKALQNR